MAVRENFIHCENVDECLERLQYDEYLAVASSRLHVKHNPVTTRRGLFCFSRENNVYAYSVAMTLKLDFELLESIDTIIANLFEFGLINMWIKWDTSPTMKTLFAAARTKDNGNENGNVVLTIEHIIGAILIMLFGYIFAIIVFIVERVVHRKVQGGTDSKFILCLHKFLNPGRIDSVTPFSLNNL